MNKIEEFYKEAGGIEYDKFDKKADKFTYYDMIGFADAYYSKQLIIADVSNRRELLTALLQYGKQRHYTPLTEEQIEALVNDFEGSL